MDWRDAFIVGFVGLQAALPLRYYLADDPFDERFAWRMFSPVRPLDCEVTFYDESGASPQRVELRPRLHAVWINLVQRARPSVVERFARQYCEAEVEAGRRPVLRVDLVCQTPDSLKLAICKVDLTDGDGDGVPDAYAGAPACEGRAPAACFRDECDDQAPDACRAARCRTRPFPRDLDFCAEGGA